MRTRTKVLVVGGATVVILCAVAAIAGPTLYRSVFASPVVEAPTLSADDSAFRTESDTPLDIAEVEGKWIITDGSFVGYRVDEVLQGEALTVIGRTPNVSGSMEFFEQTLEKAEFEVDVASITTDSSTRDTYFRQQALDTDQHPTAQFVLTDPLTATQVPALGEVIGQTLSGNLTIAGVTNRVTFEVQVRTDGSTTEIAGQIPIAFADYGIEAPSLGFVAVEPTGIIEFSLVAERE